MHNATKHPRARHRRRSGACRIGAAATALGLVCSLQVRARRYDATGDGPVGTDPSVGGLLDSDLGESIVTDRSTYRRRRRPHLLAREPPRRQPAPADVLDGPRARTTPCPTCPSWAAATRAAACRTTASAREYLVVWAGDNNVLDRSGAELTSLPKTDRARPDRPEGPDRPRLLRGRRRHQGLRRPTARSSTPPPSDRWWRTSRTTCSTSGTRATTSSPAACSPT